MEAKDHINIFVSDVAKEQIKQKLLKRGTPNSYLRIGVKGGGCSGFKYILQFEDNIDDKDLVFDIGSTKLLVDPKSILYLNGMTLDWDQNLMGRGFKFLNPLEQSKCGCGLSVSLNKDKL